MDLVRRCDCSRQKAAAAYNNLAIVEEQFGLYHAAETHYRQAIALKDQFPDAHFNLGMLLLRLGQWLRVSPNVSRGGRRAGSLRSGPPILSGAVNSCAVPSRPQRTGAGDAIQFVRFSRRRPAVRSYSVRCSGATRRLFESLPGMSEMRGRASFNIPNLRPTFRS